MSTSDLGGSVTQSQSPRTIPNLSTLVWRSLTAFGALHLALAAGIAAATAVIVGALVVGDSMRGSLQTIVLQRLGYLESAMLSQRFFNPEMLSTATEGIGPTDRTILPMIVLPSSAVELKRDSGLQRAASVQALGVTDEFWSKISSNSALGTVSLGADEVALNATLAAELNAQVGDEVTLRLPKGSGVPADSPLGRRDDTSASLPRQRVAAILPDKTAADLDFRAGQQPTRNVFVPLAALQDALEQLDKVNAAIVVSATADQPSSLSWATAPPLEAAQLVCDQMNARITPKLSD
ncbi:MAG: hypothetical protein IT423_00215 [Pirellulaceae bacterium]|nr:hypothetical protein [Pirellulaceae bacterium]